jgi:2-amino-4-hydroxy-6-hydroxymethyldihydropteridine diphosphokinase
MNKTYLLLGSNMGESQKQLEVAKKHIIRKMGEILRLSSFYSTSAWGNTNQPDFLNQVIIIDNKLSPEQTMESILNIEIKMGRIRTEKYAPRIIDIDILFYNKKIINTKNLTIPHPLMQDRNFVMHPLNELSPNFVHPVLMKNMHSLFLSCKDQLAVNKI